MEISLFSPLSTLSFQNLLLVGKGAFAVQSHVKVRIRFQDTLGQLVVSAHDASSALARGIHPGERSATRESESPAAAWRDPGPASNGAPRGPAPAPATPRPRAPCK